jgi:hypothetical protein
MPRWKWFHGLSAAFSRDERGRVSGAADNLKSSVVCYDLGFNTFPASMTPRELCVAARVPEGKTKPAKDRLNNFSDGHSTTGWKPAAILAR